MIDPTGTTIWLEHDELDRVKKKNNILRGWTFVETFDYDTMGNLKERTYPELEGVTPARMSLALQYNQANKPNNLSINAIDTVVSSTKYNSALTLEEVLLGNGVIIRRPTSPSLRNRPDLIETIGATDSSGTPSDMVLDYSWDALGRVDSVITNGRLDNYAYNARGEISSVTYAGEGTMSYSYDENGNIISRGSAEFFEHDFMNTYTDNKINSLNYDLHGNLLSDGTNAYIYNQAGRLETITNENGTITHEYDGDGRLRTNERPDGSIHLLFYDDLGRIISKYELEGTAEPAILEDILYLGRGRIATRKYPVAAEPGQTLEVDEDTADIILTWQQIDPCGGTVEVLRGTNNTLSDLAPIASGLTETGYTDIGEATVVDFRFYKVAGPAPSIHYNVVDHASSTRMVLDENGVVEAVFEYFAYGTLKEEGCESLNGGFHGRERDEKTGLDNLGLRFYSAASARFIRPDPERNSASLVVPISWNRYIFGLNNPLRNTDPDGAQSEPIEAMVEGQAVTVAPAFLAIQYMAQRGKTGRPGAKHIYMIQEFTSKGEGQLPDAWGRELLPVPPSGSLYDNYDDEQIPELINTNTKRHWKVGELELFIVPVYKREKDGSLRTFEPEEVDSAIRSVGALIYDFDQAGKLEKRCDCAGAINQYLEALPGSTVAGRSSIFGIYYGRGRKVTEWLFWAQEQSFPEFEKKE